jgi:hypothetical protein
LNRDIVGAMLTVKELMLTDGTVAEPVADADEVDVVDELDEDEQPASLTSVTHSHSPHPFARIYPNKTTGTPV